MSSVVDWVTKAVATRDWRKLGLAYGSVVLVMLVGHQILKSSIVEKVYPETLALKKMKLMDHEKELMMMMPSITTVTFYKTNKIPETYIKKKLAEIIRKNPWLCGRLLRSNTDGLHLGYPEVIDTAEDVAKRLKEHFHTIIDFDLPEHLSYAEIVKYIEHLAVSKGNNCINKPYANLFRVSLLKLKGRDEVALVVSLSHVLGDGYTYYTLLNMLDCHTPVEHLVAERSEQYNTEMKRLLGQSCFDYMRSTITMTGLIGCSLIRPEPQCMVVKIDNNWLKRQKNSFLENREETGDTDLDYVSNNDILTSWFSRLSNINITIMSINTRQRIRKFTNNLAGNYENSIIYNKSEDYSTPGAIRKSLRTYRNTSGTLPGTIKTLLWNTGLVSNWSSFYKQIDISDAHNNVTCSYLYHIPIVDIREVSVWREGAVVFHFDEHTLGLLIGTRVLTRQKIEDSGVGAVLKTLGC